MNKNSRIKKYKKMVGCTREQATIAIRYEILEKRNIKETSICPLCKQSSLVIESDCGDYNYDAWVECNNCEFTDHADNYEPLFSWYQFDEVLVLCENPSEYGFSKKEWKKLLRENTKRKKEELS